MTLLFSLGKYLALISLVGLGIFSLFYLFEFWLAAPFKPSRRKIINQAIDALDLGPDDVVYDLGSGDGRVVIEAAKRGVKLAVGFEINPILVCYSIARSKLLGVNNARFYHRSLWESNLAECNKLFIYLLPRSMEKLVAKIEAEMPTGGYVVSNRFALPKMQPVKVIDEDINIYQI